MIQKQVKFSNERFCRKPLKNYNRRPVLFSCDDINRMAVESSRARLISQLVSKPEELSHNEFASYFHATTTAKDPSYLITSHTTQFHPPTPCTRPVIPAFSSLVGLRWSPCVEASSMEALQTDIVQETSKFNCRCEDCSMKHRPSRVSSSNTIKPGIFRDNIMTFSDKNTMTPKLRDAHCSCGTVPSTPKASDVSVTAHEMPVTDMQEKLQFHQPPNKGSPIPILKKQEEDFMYKYYCNRNERPMDFHHEAEKDTDLSDDYHAPIKTKSIKSFLKLKRNGFRTLPPGVQNPRKILYNEGISDTIANQHSKTPVRVPSPINVKKESSKSSFISKWFIKPEKRIVHTAIPYSHRNDSRYHYTCKRSGSKQFDYDDEDEVRHLVASPEIARRTFTRQSMNRGRVPSIKLPKRLLCSEKDIESYIDKDNPKMHIPKQI